MQVAVGILEQCSELLLEMDDMEMILNHIKQDVPKWPKPVLQVSEPREAALPTFVASGVLCRGDGWLAAHAGL
jgi:hypothetical protein